MKKIFCCSELMIEKIPKGYYPYYNSTKSTINKDNVHQSKKDFYPAIIYSVPAKLICI